MNYTYFQPSNQCVVCEKPRQQSNSCSIWHAWILLGFFSFISCWNLKEAYGKGTSDPSDDEEWSGNSTNPKGNLEDSDSDSLDWSPQPAKTCSRRARGRQQNDEHTSRSEQR